MPDDVQEQIRQRRRAGEPAKAIAIDLGVSGSTVYAYTAHLPQGYAKHEARRVAILACLDAGLSVSATAEKVPCKISDVMHIVWALRAEAEYRTPEQRAADEEAKRVANLERARLWRATVRRARGTGQTSSVAAKHTKKRGRAPACGELVAKVREMYLAGVLCVEIARALGTSTSTILKYTGDLPRRPPGRRPKRSNVEALAEVSEVRS